MKSKLTIAMLSFIMLYLAPISQAFAYGEDEGSDAGAFLTVSLSIFSIVTVAYLIVSTFKDNN